MALQIIQRLLNTAANTPDAEAFRELDEAGRCRRLLTYGHFADAVLATALRLRATVGEQPVVLISHPNELEYAVAFFGVLAAGGTVFPIHPRLTPQERATAATRSNATAYIGADSVSEGLSGLGLLRMACENLPPATCKSPRASVRAERAADLSEQSRLFLQSSGTTGPPSLVERSGHSLDAVARNVAESVGLRPDDRVLGLVPMCHSYGMENVLLGPVWAGSCVCMCRDIASICSPSKDVESTGTVLPGVPTLFELLAGTMDASSNGAHAPLGNVRCAYSAGASLPPCVLERLRGKLRVPVGQLYGMTEIGSVTFNDPQKDGFDPMSVGLPMAGVDIRIVDPDTHDLDRPHGRDREGEVAVSAPSMLTGYVRDDVPVCEAPATLRDGYFLTGDLGRLDLCGRLTITGRLKLVVDVGGLKVNLLEVERALCEHQAVHECVVVPVAVSETVSRLKAYVVPRRGVPLEADDLRAFLRPRLSSHKIPRSFEVRESVPRSAAGKVLRYKL